MSGRFRAFTFVDRIVAWTPGRDARGRFQIPADVGSFPQSLIAEAVGQLAAWVSMSHVGFRGRPVAGIAAETLFHRAAEPGDALDLEVAIESCDDEAVAYDGVARVNGIAIAELRHCLGPMLPMTDFDDPQAMRADFDLLTTVGRTPGLFRGVPPLVVAAGAHEPGRSLDATLNVPARAPFFDDHFARRPVFPGTLLLEAQMQLALELARESKPPDADARLRTHRVTNVKIRTFIAPGTVVELSARSRGDALPARIFDVAARVGERNVAAARVEIDEGGAA